MVPPFGRRSVVSKTVLIFFFDSELSFDYIFKAARILACIDGDW